MKRILLSITAMVFSAGAFAQLEPMASDTAIYQAAATKHPDGFLMKGGKVMRIKDQKMTLLKNDTTLANGTVIMTNGSYMRKGEAKAKFKEGQHMDFSGRLIMASTTNDKMYLVSDTIKHRKN